MVPFAISMVVLLVVVGAVRSCDTDAVRDALEDGVDANRSLITLSGTATVIPTDGPNVEVITTVQDTEGSVTTRRLARVAFTPEGSEARWTSEPVDASASRFEIAIVGERLFAAYEDQLLALDAVTGKPAWQATLRDKVTTGCESCFAVVRGRLIVRTTDAYVTAYGTASSETLWSRRLNSTSGSVSVVGDRLFVVDDPEDTGQVTPVALVDPASGRTIRATAPTCPRGQSTPWDLEMRPGDPVRPVPGSADVMAAFGFGDGCVVRWNPDTGTTTWTSRLTNMDSFDQEGIVVGARDMVLSNRGGSLVTIYLPNGKARQLEVPTDVAATPGAIVERTLVANSTTTRGTARGGLIGYDLSTGQRLWAQSSLGTAEPVSSSPYFNSDALFDGSPRSLLVPVDGGLEVFVFDGEPRRFTVTPLDLDDGDLGPAVQRAYLTRYDSGTVSLTIEGIDGDHVVISIDSLLQSIPVSGKGPIVSYPDKD